jgi:hypothetical protein
VWFFNATRLWFGLFFFVGLERLTVRTSLRRTPNAGPVSSRVRPRRVKLCSMFRRHEFRFQTNRLVRDHEHDCEWKAQWQNF